jgi:glycerol kinase
VFHPHPGWVEHDPLELLANVEACLEAAGPVDAIGLANQGESCLAWDRVSGAPLSPVIVWQDDRTAAAVARLRAAGLGPLVAERAGSPLDPYFSASKLAWLLEHNPAARAARRAGRLRLGTSDAFLLRRLTGVDATDATTASRTSLMNLRDLAWDPALCEAFGVPGELLPPIRTTSGDFGLWRGVPVRASVVDQQAALHGHGCRAPGEAKVTFGTGAFALALSAGPEVRSATGLTSTVAWSAPGETRYALEGGVYDAGAAVEWAMRIGVVESMEALAGIAGPPAIERGLVFVPALSGLGCPDWDRSASGLWLGMSTATTRQDMVRSLLEGVALQTREVLAALDGETGREGPLSVDGGLTGSGYFLQFLADVLDRPVSRPAFAELTALGCAGLAGLEGASEAGARRTYDPRACDREATIHTYRRAADRCRGWREP